MFFPNNAVEYFVDALYEDYEPTKAVRLISKFVIEDLSNWYVRLSRRRFWKGVYEQDKIAAYQTLYNCLDTVAKLMAPIAPFYSDRLYQDLDRTTQKENNASVHLAYFPKADLDVVDKSLEKKMQRAQQIVSLVLSLRKKEKIIEKLKSQVNSKHARPRCNASRIWIALNAENNWDFFL